MRAGLGIMPTRININGVITGPEDAQIPVLDHGFLFGDSVYETLRTYKGKPFLFSRHFARLEHSAGAIDLRLPWSESTTREEIQQTLLHGECRIRLMITRGVGELNPDIETSTDPTAIIIVVPLMALPDRIYEQGVDVVISSVRRSARFADIKTGSLIHQVLARRDAKLKHAYEAILLTGLRMRSCRMESQATSIWSAMAHSSRRGMMPASSRASHVESFWISHARSA
ncbi:MAG: hypothetical protein DMG14_05105 [Acidobacteria bacterium]|nr:MAG: hypothetical protein DMG14_05105 [Acidobacteriota bacterium]